LKPVFISAESLVRWPRALGVPADEALGQQTRFDDLPLPARLVLAVPLREWDLQELRSRANPHQHCEHLGEPAMIH